MQTELEAFLMLIPGYINLRSYQPLYWWTEIIYGINVPERSDLIGEGGGGNYCTKVGR